VTATESVAFTDAQWTAAAILYGLVEHHGLGAHLIPLFWTRLTTPRASRTVGCGTTSVDTQNRPLMDT
jgi:hypothetical protein